MSKIEVLWELKKILFYFNVIKIFSKMLFRNWYRFIYVLPNIDNENIKLITNY